MDTIPCLTNVLVREQSLKMRRSIVTVWSSFSKVHSAVAPVSLWRRLDLAVQHIFGIADILPLFKQPFGGNASWTSQPGDGGLAGKGEDPGVKIY